MASVESLRWLGLASLWRWWGGQRIQNCLVTEHLREIVWRRFAVAEASVIVIFISHLPCSVSFPSCFLRNFTKIAMSSSWELVSFGPMRYSPSSLQQLAQNALGEDKEILLPLLVDEWKLPKNGHLSKLFTTISTSAYLATSNYCDLYSCEAQKRLEAEKSPLLLKLLETRVRSEFDDLSDSMQDMTCGRLCRPETPLPVQQLLQELLTRFDGDKMIFSWDTSGSQLEKRWDEILSSSSWKSFAEAHWSCALKFLEELLSRFEILRRH